MTKRVKDGNAYKNFKAKETRLVERIDKREEDRETVDNMFNSYTTADNGERTWSF